MRKPWAANVALVGFESEDLASLRMIFDCEDSQLGPNCKWKLCRQPNVDATVAALRQDSIPIVLCDHDTSPESWKRLLDHFAGLSRPPLLIVASRLADERLWAEALNLGAHDVLAKPFAIAEVVRTASLAYFRWQRLYSAPAMASHMVA